MRNEWEVQSKRGSCSKLSLALSSLDSYKLVNQNNVRIIFSQIKEVLFKPPSSDDDLLDLVNFPLFVLKASYFLVGLAAGLDRLRDFFVFFLSFKTKTATSLLAFSLPGVLKKGSLINISSVFVRHEMSPNFSLSSFE